MAHVFRAEGMTRGGVFESKTNEQKYASIGLLSIADFDNKMSLEHMSVLFLVHAIGCGSTICKLCYVLWGCYRAEVLIRGGVFEL